MAYKREDKKIVIVLLNKADKDISINLRIDDEVFGCVLPRKAISTGVVSEQ